MRRRLLSFASIVSLLLCAATCGLWVRSYWRLDGAYSIRFLYTQPFANDGTIPQDIFRCISVSSSRGHLALSWWEMDQDASDNDGADFVETSLATTKPYDLGQRPTSGVQSHVIPDWSLVLATLVIPLWRWRKRRGGRGAGGLCITC